MSHQIEEQKRATNCGRRFQMEQDETNVFNSIYEFNDFFCV